MSGGPLELGVFATPGALVAPRIAICEAAFDALSLAAAGLPAIALIGTTSRPDWLRTALSRTQVAIATDADVAGDAAAQSLATWLSAGSKPIRMRPPEEHKDWNGALLGLGLDSLNNQLSSVARGTASEAGASPAAGDTLHVGDDARWAKTSDGRVPDTPTYHAAVTVYERLRRVIEDLRLAADASVDPDIAARLRAEAFALQCGPYWEAGETIQDEIDALEEQPASPPVRLV
jgi:DNA primase